MIREKDRSVFIEELSKLKDFAEFIQNQITFEKYAEIVKSPKASRSFQKEFRKHFSNGMQCPDTKDNWKLKLAHFVYDIQSKESDVQTEEESTEEEENPEYQPYFQIFFIEAYQLLIDQIKSFLENNMSVFKRNCSKVIESLHRDFTKNETSPDRVKNSFNAISNIFHDFFFYVYCAGTILYPRLLNSHIPDSKSLRRFKEIFRNFEKFEHSFQQFGLSPRDIFQGQNIFAACPKTTYSQIFSDLTEEPQNEEEGNEEDDGDEIYEGGFQIQVYLNDIDSALIEIEKLLNSLIGNFNDFLTQLNQQFFHLQCHWLDLFIQAAILIPSKSTFDQIFTFFTPPSVQEAQQPQKQSLPAQAFSDLLSIIKQSRQFNSIAEFSNALIFLFDMTTASLLNHCPLFTILEPCFQLKPNENDVSLFGQLINYQGNINENLRILINNVNGLLSPNKKTKIEYVFSDVSSSLLKVDDQKLYKISIHQKVKAIIELFETNIESTFQPICEFKSDDIPKDRQAEEEPTEEEETEEVQTEEAQTEEAQTEEEDVIEEEEEEEEKPEIDPTESYDPAEIQVEVEEEDIFEEEEEEEEEAEEEGDGEADGEN